MRHAIGKISTVLRAMTAKDVRQLRHRGFPGRSKIVHEFVNRLEGPILGLGREVSVDGGSGWSAVAEVSLYKPQIYPRLQQMSGIAVPIMPTSA